MPRPRKRDGKAGLLPVHFGKTRQGANMRQRLRAAGELAERLEADLRLTLDLTRGCEQVLRLWLHCGSPACLRARGCTQQLACLCLLRAELGWFAPEFLALQRLAEDKWKAHRQLLRRSGALALSVDDAAARQP